MARKALSLLHDGQTPSYWTAAHPLLSPVKLFPPQLRLTVITNSVPIVMQLIEHPGAEVIFTGGRIFKESQVTGGLDTIQMLRRVRADICFLGVCSLHPCWA